MKAMVDTMPDGVRMIGANKQAYMYAGVSPLRRSRTTEYIKMRVVGEDRGHQKTDQTTVPHLRV